MNRTWLTILLLPALACGCSKAQPASVSPISLDPAVKVVHAQYRTVNRTVEQPGVIAAYERTALYAKVASYVEKWNVDIGDRVKAGQLLAEIASPEIDQQLRQAKADLQQSENNLDLQTANLDLARTTMARYQAADAEAAVAKLSPEEKQIQLGQRAINRYGCFSCHEIKGFENAQSIGTDLSEEGSKLVTRLDFAFITNIPHTSKLAWFRTKLHDPRIFDKGRELPPLDKLRMPNYEFSEDEVNRLLTAIMSLQREIQPPSNPQPCRGPYWY